MPYLGLHVDVVVAMYVKVQGQPHQSLVIQPFGLQIVDVVVVVVAVYAHAQAQHQQSLVMPSLGLQIVVDVVDVAVSLSCWRLRQCALKELQQIQQMASVVLVVVGSC